MNLLLDIGSEYPYRVVDFGRTVIVMIQTVDHKAVGVRVEIPPQIKVRRVVIAEGRIIIFFVGSPYFFIDVML